MGRPNKGRLTAAINGAETHLDSLPLFLHPTASAVDRIVTCTRPLPSMLAKGIVDENRDATLWATVTECFSSLARQHL